MAKSAITSFRPNPAGIAALNDPEGIVGRATQRAAEATAGAIRGLILAYGLVETGRMLDDVQTQLTVANSDEVRVQVGTPNAVYALYQRQHFFLEALAQLSAGDFNE